jgi:hypothetical protein
MAYSTRAREKRLAQLRAEVSRPGFDRHASRLNNVSDLPADLQSPSLAVLAGREQIQTILLFPHQIQRGWHYVPQQALLFTATGVIHLLASIWPEQEPQVISLDGCNLMYVKATLLLLYGYLEIVAPGQEVPVRLGMEFNTVAWYSLATPLRQLLGSSKAPSCRPVDQVAYAPEARQSFERLPFKFFNGVQIYGLLPGEQLEELTFQEHTSERWSYFFRRPKTPDTVLMLTTNYVIVIQEDIKVRQGWIVTYIPRSGISRIQSQDDGMWSTLSIELMRQDQTVNCTLLLAKQAVDMWRAQWMSHGGEWQDICLATDRLQSEEG